MGIMSLIKWSILLMAALMFFHTPASSHSCKRFIFIVDFNSSNGETNILTLQCNNVCLQSRQCPSVARPLLIKQCFMGSFAGIICPIGISNYSFNVTKQNDTYEISLNEDVTGLILRFIVNASNLLPSSDTAADYLNRINDTAEDLCKDLFYDQTACAGRNSSYVILVKQNGSMDCMKCTPPSSPNPSSQNPPNPNTSSPSPSSPSPPSPSSPSPPSPSSPSPTSPSPSSPSSPSPTSPSPSSPSSPSPPSPSSPSPSSPSPSSPNPSSPNPSSPNPSSPSPTSPSPPSPSSPSSPSPPKSSRPVTEAIKLMDDLPLHVETLLNGSSSAQITNGTATGFIYKQSISKDVSIGYSLDEKMTILNDTSQETHLSWSVRMPAEAFDMALSKKNQTPFVGVMRFPDLSMENSNASVLNNEVIGITMGVSITNLSDTIDIYFRHVDKTNPTMNCSSWDGTDSKTNTPKWTTYGCYTNITNGMIKCSCTHLTFFAILMSQPDQAISESDLTTLTYISSIGCGLSTFFLLVGLFIHFVMWRLKSRLGTTILMNLFVALILLNITFLSNQQITNTNNSVACVIIASVMHFSMLATFSWFFIHGLHFYLSLKAINMNIRKFKLSIIALGWGFPAVVVIVIAASGTYTFLTNVQMCWIRNIYVHYIVNVGYYALVFTFTLTVFVMIVRKITQARFMKQNTVATARKRIAAIFSLTVLLGLTWGVAFFSYGAMAVPSYYIFTILNSFQGLFLFLYYYYFRNDDLDLNQSSSNTALSVRKPTNSSSTMTSEPVTETEY